MGKGSGGGGGNKNSGGAGGRSAWKGALNRGMTEALATWGVYGAIYADMQFNRGRGTVWVAKNTLKAAAYLNEKTNRGAQYAAKNVTGPLRDKVRAWAQRKAADEAAKRTNPGAINTEGIGIHAVKGILGGGKMSDPIPKVTKGTFGSLPDKSYIQFKKGGNIYKAADIKALARDAARAGTREVRS